jgi:hypothetical protein
MKLQEYNANKVVYRFRHAHDFLLAFYEAKKAQKPDWSYAAWARKLGQSKVAVVRTVRGTLPINEAMEAAYIKFFQFDKTAEKYFRLIVAYDKLIKLFPNLTISLPQLDEARTEEIIPKKLELAADSDLAFWARIEIWWILAIFSSPGLDKSQLESLNESFHPGLKDTDFKALVKECLDRGILEEHAGKIIYRSENPMFQFDGKDMGPHLITEKVVHHLRRLQDIVREDTSSDELRFYNQFFTFKMKKKNFVPLRSKMIKFINQLIIEFDDEGGDIVIDAQAFFTPVWKLPK